MATLHSANLAAPIGTTLPVQFSGSSFIDAASCLADTPNRLKTRHICRPTQVTTYSLGVAHTHCVVCEKIGGRVVLELVNRFAASVEVSR
jgi:hypothetical protein